MHSLECIKITNGLLILAFAANLIIYNVGGNSHPTVYKATGVPFLHSQVGLRHFYTNIHRTFTISLQDFVTFRS
uniref:Putative secreted protein salivary gland overexpressed n=1 Tax=Rhipicephalus microplus TaxID=6941 RepID=A0A6M2DBJ7_RHIMP